MLPVSDSLLFSDHAKLMCTYTTVCRNCLCAGDEVDENLLLSHHIVYVELTADKLDHVVHAFDCFRGNALLVGDMVSEESCKATLALSKGLSHFRPSAAAGSARRGANRGSAHVTASALSDALPYVSVYDRSGLGTGVSGTHVVLSCGSCAVAHHTCS